MWDRKAEDLCLGDPHEIPSCYNPASSGQLSPLFFIRTANDTGHIVRTILSARLPALMMADDHDAQNPAATSDDFRDLARTVGIELSIALQGHVASADKSRGFVLADIQDSNHMKIIQKVVMDFELKVCVD